MSGCFNCGAVHQRCGECGVIFYLHEERYNDLRANHETFHCPNGHQRHFAKPAGLAVEQAIKDRDAASRGAQIAENRAAEAEKRGRAARHALNSCASCGRAATRRESLGRTTGAPTIARWRFRPMLERLCRDAAIANGLIAQAHACRSPSST